MRIRTIASVLLLTVGSLYPTSSASAARLPVSAADNDFIVRAPASKIAGILERHGLTEVDCLDAPPAGKKICRVRAAASAFPSQVIEDLVVQEPELIAVEEVFLASLPETYDDVAVEPSMTIVAGALGDTSSMQFGTDGAGSERWVWTAYVDQPAASLIEVTSAQDPYAGSGAVVAVIDSGIDPQHPLLDGHLVPGYDFILEQPGDASEWPVLDESSMAILGESSMAILGSEEVLQLNESSMAILGSDQADQLDPGQIPPSFGHGTMVAGIIHRVAPAAKIMPLRVFGSDGTGSVFNVVRAIRFAVDNGATVINMSFSLEGYSEELNRAVKYAKKNGVVCVASVGNEGRPTLTYPAALGGVVGVASTDSDDYLSSFSNYGDDLVRIAAPGEDLITAFPGGGWASASGTSFAAPWLSGLVALFADKGGDGQPGDVTHSETTSAMTAADPVLGDHSDDAGVGRVNLRTAMDNL